MSPDIMKHVAGKDLASSAASLSNYFRSCIKDVEYPAIIPQVEREVMGVVYFDLSPKELQRLDLFEGSYYKREKENVSLLSGKNCTAMVYVFRQRYHHLLTGETWSFDKFLKEGKEKFLSQYSGFQEIAKPR